MSAPLPCLAGTAALDAFSTCLKCDFGETSDAARTGCVNCEPGTYASAMGSPVCETCGPGAYTTQSRATTCVNCVNGSVRTSPTGCTACAAGSFVAEKGVECLKCARGKFRATEGGLACETCPAGTYASTIGATRCEPCPLGTHTNADGAISPQQCVECSAGWYLAPTTGACVVCDDTLHYYCPGGGVRRPRTLPVPGQTYVQVRGGTMADDYVGPCRVCVAGVTYASAICGTNGADTVCTPCAAPVLGHTYVVEVCTPTRDTVLAPCEGNTTWLAPGGVCNPCPPGTHQAGCVPCPVGHFKAEYGPANCTQCPEGTQSLGGASRCTTAACALGTFAPDGVHCTLLDPNSVPWRTDALSAEWDVRGLVATQQALFFWVADARGQVWRIDRRTQAAWLAAQTAMRSPSRLVALSGTQVLLLLSEVDGVMRLDVATSVTLSLRPLPFFAALKNVTGGAALTAKAALLADHGAHCVWLLHFTDEGAVQLHTWRGKPGQASTEQSRGGSALLAFPLDVAYDVTRPSEPAYVLDAHAVWAFEALTKAPTGTVADLTYVCGGGATRLSDGMETVASADVDLAGSMVVELAAGAAGGAPVLFMLSVTQGVWALVVGSGSSMRRIGSVVPRALVWSDGRLWGLRAEGGVAEAGLGAVVRLEPSPELRCLCEAGLYCDDAVRACVAAPAGTVAPAWASAPVACPVGTLFDATTQTCGECALPEQYTTFEAGDAVCQRRCERHQVYYADACHEGCTAPGEYLVPSKGCVACPLGTAPSPDGMACQPCSTGQYGAAPGVCAECEGNATTLFPGATLCLQCGEGLYPDRERGGECAECTVGACARVTCHDTDGRLSGACDTTARRLVTNVSGPLSVTSTGLTVVWDAEASDDDDDAAQRFEPKGTCVWRNGAAWVGDCALGGDADGARSTGVARLRPIVDLALVAVDGIGAVLYISTLGDDRCASVRGAALYDGTLSTLVSEDATRMPTLLWPTCSRLPFVVAAARGVNELLLASGGQVWRIEDVLTRAKRTELLAVPAPTKVTALCLRGHLDGAVGMALIANDAGLVWVYGAPHNLSLWRHLDQGAAARELACAGRHAWWIDARGDGWTAGMGEAWVEGCLAGFVRTAGHGCAQVGVGQFTITGESVRACPVGTAGVDCAPCPPGTVSDPWQAHCQPCPPPLLANGDACVASCPRGTTLMTGAASCAPCPAGSSSVGGTAPCAPCAAGEYVNASSNGVCAPCPEGFTSRTGSVRCVAVCPPGKCAPTGEECESLTQDWEIITSVRIEGGFMLTAVTVGEGGTVLYADGGQLYYFVDDCVVDAAVLSVLHPCQRSGQALLPENPCPACVRGFTALALAGGFDASNRYGVGGNVRFVYVLSYSAHALYRFPLRFQASSSVLVDVDATRALLATGGADLEGWRLAGGAAGMVDGPLSVARFHLPTEMELSRDDTRLYVSDAANQRIRVVDLITERVSTLLGDGVASWRPGPIRCAVEGCARAAWPGGMGLSADGRRLYLTQYSTDSVGVVELAETGGRLSTFCQLNWQNQALYTSESCVVAEGSRSCFLYRPFDVLASPSGRVYVASTNALTFIDASTLACQQVGGEWWAFRDTAGFQDGGVDKDGVPLSRLSRPSKLALDASRGILYVADFSNGALRRAFVDGECRCAQGSILLDEAQACYNPTPAWDPRQKRVADCPPGSFALDGDVDCRACDASAEAFYGVAASACILWRTQTTARTQLVTTGVAYAKVRSTPEPEGASHLADWFGDPTAAFTRPVRWNDIFRSNSPVTYRPGVGEGRVPFGGEFVTLVWRPDVRLWDLSSALRLAPRRLVPGLWYPCVAGFVQGETCDCSTAAAAFAAPADETDEATQQTTLQHLVRWHELRLSAAMSGARVVTTSMLKAYADGSNSVGDAVQQWSLFLAMGSDVRPSFPAFVHYGAAETRLPSQPEVKVTLRMPLSTPKTSMARCVAGWPAHYECAEGFVWVGPNTTALNASQFVRMRTLTGQIACLSCLPGTYSRRSAQWAGGPYRCARCPLGHYASGVATAGACAPCMAGTYASQAGATACVACPVNHYTRAPGAMQARDCSPCPPGTGGCVDCVPGEWQDRAAQNVCKGCALGTYSNTSNATVCETCPVGTYQPYGGAGACLECPEPSRFFPDASATACVECVHDACPLVRDGVCGKGCGLNRYWDQTTCRACPVTRRPFIFMRSPWCIILIIAFV